jgi:hypothetical protein
MCSKGQQMATAELTAYPSTHRDGYGAASPRGHQGAWIFPNVGDFFLALFVGALFAFWPPYLSHLPNTDVNAHFHGIVAVIWCGLLIAPPLLIRTNRALHRRLGTFSKAVAPLFIVGAILLAHHRVRIMSEATFAVRAPSLYLGLAATVLFAASYLLALRYSRRQALHARFMISTGLTMIDPVVVRLFNFYTPTFSHLLMYQVWEYGLTDFLLPRSAVASDDEDTGSQGVSEGRAALPHRPSGLVHHRPRFSLDALRLLVPLAAASIITKQPPMEGETCR